MRTILTGIWDFSFITNYKHVNFLSLELIETNTRNYMVALSVAMGSQLMNSILYLMNYFIQCNDPCNINYNTTSFPTGTGLIKRPFMYVNVLWFVMPSYVILYVLNKTTHKSLNY